MQEARELACVLTVPHLRIPLALAFFAARPGVLLQPALRVLLTHVLFTPGPYVLTDARSVPAGSPGGVSAEAAEPVEEEFGADAAALVVSRLGGILNALGPLGAVPVAPEHRASALGHILGALHLEAVHAPATLVVPLLELLEALLARASGLAPSEGRSPHAAALLWGLRTAVQVEGTLAAVSRDESASSAGDEGRATALQRADYLVRLRALIRGPVRLYLSRCLAAAERANDIPCAAVLHAHTILLWQHADDADLLPQQDHGGAAVPGIASSVDHDALLHCGHASLLASGTYVAVWMRTARLRAAADAEAEFARLAEARGGAGADSAQNRRSPFMTRPTLPAGYTSSACDLLSSAPWAAATATTLRHRDALLVWLDAMAAVRVSVLDQGTLLPGSAADVALSHCLRVALRRPRVDLLSFEREGGATSSSAALCRVVVESEHPYRPSTDLFKRLHFPGTPPCHDRAASPRATSASPPPPRLQAPRSWSWRSTRAPAPSCRTRGGRSATPTSCLFTAMTRCRLAGALALPAGRGGRESGGRLHS